MRAPIFIILFFASSLASANDTTNCKICADEDDSYKKAICFYQYSKNKINNENESNKILSCLLNQWSNRGSGGSPLISDAFLFQTEKYPTNFFLEMSNEQKIYSEWLNKLENYSFVWYKGAPSPLENKRKRIISKLKNHKINNSKLDKMRVKLINTLVNIKPRVVN